MKILTSTDYFKTAEEFTCNIDLDGEIIEVANLLDSFHDYCARNSFPPETKEQYVEHQVLLALYGMILCQRWGRLYPSGHSDYAKIKWYFSPKDNKIIVEGMELVFAEKPYFNFLLCIDDTTSTLVLPAFPGLSKFVHEGKVQHLVDEYCGKYLLMDSPNYEVFFDFKNLHQHVANSLGVECSSNINTVIELCLKKWFKNAVGN